MFGAVKPGFRMLSANFKPKKNSCGIARFPCDSTVFLLFFVAADAYSGPFCEFFCWANENSFFMTEPNKDNIIQQLFWADKSHMAVCVSQFFCRRLFGHFKPRSTWRKWSLRPQIVLYVTCWTLNFCLVIVAWSSSPITVAFLNSARALGVLLLCCQSLQFLETNISQGSLATPLRFGWICNDRFIANFLPSVTVKKVENRSIFGEDVDKSLVSCFFDSRCSTI